MGDLARTIGEGVGGLIRGSIDALATAFSTVVGALQQALPGPLLPIAVVGVIALVFWWLFRKQRA